MEILDLAKTLGGLPVSVLLLAALIVVYLRGEKRETEHRTELAALVEKHDEMITQYQSLVREALVTLTRVGDFLK